MGLANLTLVMGNLNIYNNEKLTDLQGLDRLQQVGKDLNIYDNEKLVDLLGLANLATVGEKVFIVDNSNLPTSEARALADRVAGGEVSILNNKN